MKRFLTLFLLILLPAPAFASASFTGGANGYAKATASEDSIMTGDFCLMFWLKTSDTDAFDPIFQVTGSVSNVTVNMNNDGGGTKTGLSATGNSADANAPASTQDGVWHAMIWSRSGLASNDVTVYQDNVAGTAVSNAVSMPVTPAAGFSVGDNVAGQGTPAGKITRFAYVAAACSAGDRSTFQSTCAVPATTKYKYDFSSSATLNTDTSGNAHTLTAQGTGAGWTYSTDEPAACSASFNFGLWFPF